MSSPASAPESEPRPTPGRLRRLWNRPVPEWLGTLIIGGAFFTCCAGPQCGNQYRLFHRTFEKSRVGAASGDIGAFHSALAQYQADVKTKRFPATLRQLVSDNAAGWAGPYLPTISADPWGNQYHYSSGEKDYTIASIHHTEFSFHRSETIRYILSDGVLSTLP